MRRRDCLWAEENRRYIDHERVRFRARKWRSVMNTMIVCGHKCFMGILRFEIDLNYDSENQWRVFFTMFRSN